MRRILAAAVIFAIPVWLFGFELEGVQPGSGNVIIINAEDVSVSPEPNPVALEFGVSVPMSFDGLYFEPGIRLYGTYVIPDPSTYKAVPAAVETADKIGVLNIELRPELGYCFSLDETMLIGVTGAPVFTFRIPVAPYDNATDDEMAIVSEYYFSSARFLSIYIGSFFSWDFTEEIALRLRLGTALPVYHIWDGDDAGFFDQMTITPEIAFLWRF